MVDNESLIKSGSTQGFREGSPVNTLVMQQN